MVFCNVQGQVKQHWQKSVTILILIDGFLQYLQKEVDKTGLEVTILILIDGFLQYELKEAWETNPESQSLF